MQLSIRRVEALRACWPWLPLWLLAATIAMFMHGPMPMFSTRTLSVAWEMWHRHRFLVPYLNGVPYSDKPPLLFWLIDLGWWVGGVGDVWPRLLEIVLGGVQLVLFTTLAYRLFPERTGLAKNAPWLLLAFTYGFLFSLQIMYEVLLAACVLAALLALLPGRREAPPRFGWFACAVALGLLTKGPVMLVHVVFPWLLGPWWNAWARRERWRWYVHGVVALLAGCVILLAWALLAAWQGGAHYREQLLFHQTAGRVVDAFAHAKPLWWYLPMLPVLIFPFALWPRLWVALAALRPPFEPGMRFVLAWLLPVLLIFSLVSGKQPYYLLPEYAGFALLLAVALYRFQHHQAALAGRGWLTPWPLALLSFAFAVALYLLPLGVENGVVHDSRLLAMAAYGIPFGAIYTALGVFLLVPGKVGVPRVAVIGMIGAVAANGLFTLALWPTFDLAPAATLLAHAEAHGQPVANLESYDGQFQFLGRSTQPIASLHGACALKRWANAHPDGLVITYPKHQIPVGPHSALYAQPFRGVWLAIWKASVLATPGVALSARSQPSK